MATFVYYEYTNPTTGDTVTDDMSKKDWDRIQRDPQRARNFRFVREVTTGPQPTPYTPAPTVPSAPVAPPAPVDMNKEPEFIDDPYQCPLCDFAGSSDMSLMIHKRKMHT